MALNSISWQGILVRFVAAAVLVFATYNPEGYSYYHWVVGQWPAYDALKIFVGVVLLIGWTIYVRATLSSLGLFGLLLASAFFGALLWVVIDFGWVAADNARVISYLVLLLFCGVLATGISWSHIRRRITGQVDVDEIETG